MTSLIYITAVLISLVLERQERRHLFELNLEYRRLGKTMPPPKPKLPMLESWLNVVLGLFLMFGLGLLFLWTNFSMLKYSAKNPALGPHQSEWDFTATILATGVALTFLGIRSLILNYRHKRFVSSKTPLQ